MTRFERHGTCKMCGNCCHKSMSSPQMWSRMRQSELGENVRETTLADRTVVLEDACYQLGEDNRCEIYDTRPEICRQFPRGPCDLIAGCGYYFLEFCGVNDDEVIAVHRPGVPSKVV